MPTLQYKKFIYVTFFLSLIFADVGGTISLQGVLRDPNGTTVTDGSYSLTIKLYETSDQVGGEVYSEVVDAAIQNGVFSIELGATVTSSAALDLVPFNTTYYVGITVEDGLEMTPRTKLTVSPYSMAMYGSSNIVPNTGNVGLGTLDPQAVLHIKDAENNAGEDLLLIEDNVGGDQIRVEDDGTLTLPTIGAKVGVGTAIPDAMLDINSSGTSDDFLSIKDGSGTEKLKVDNDGTLTLPTIGAKVGVGTAIPDAMLDINSSGTSDDFLSIKDGSGTEKLKVDNDGTLTIPDGGKLGIGTSSPNATLDIKPASTDNYSMLVETTDDDTTFYVQNDGDLYLKKNIYLYGDTTAGEGRIIFADGNALLSPWKALSSYGISNAGDAFINSDATGSGEGDIVFSVNSATKLTIDNDGDVGIGVTNPDNKLDVAGTAQITGAVDIGGNIDMNSNQIDNLMAASADDHVVRFDQIYPVGSVYINASNSANPSTYLGVGTWTRIGAGKVMVGQDPSDSDFNQTSDEGGNKTATLNIANLAQHNHTVNPASTSLSLSVSQSDAGAHSHTYTAPGSTPVDAGGDATDNTDVSTGGTNTNEITSGVGNHNHGIGVSGTVDIGEFNSGQTGSGDSFSILQPYIVVYMWVRTG